ncbi:MAG: hypothetical protein H0V88_04540 [Pyrinomonadaceae bacterium]|nr:hypothetical protein [Pyrinomonadaceae bacterium]
MINTARGMMNRKSMRRTSPFIVHRSALILVMASLLIPLAGCGARRTPDLKRIFTQARKREGKRPLIVIPGILGSQLVNSRTGEIVWPSAIRSADDGLSLPVSADLKSNRDGLVPTKIVKTARLLKFRIVPEVYVYQELIDGLQFYGGYREGDWNAPPPDGDRDAFYVFAYDWRRDNVENARLLTTRIEELKRKLNQPSLRFNIVAHSMGGLLARYAAMYGDADLPEGEATARPTWAGANSINNIFLFGTPNNGSMEAFATLLGGYSITEGLRRRLPLLNKLSREDAVTIPALFQLLPHDGAERFLDENLKSIKVDLYDPSVWQRYKWSAANNADFRRRFEDGNTRADDPPQRGSLKALDAYFNEVIKRAKRFHEAINLTGSGESQVKIFVFGGDCEETLSAAVILKSKDGQGWTTLTEARRIRISKERSIPRREVIDAMYEPGDGRVTRRSLLGLRSTNENVALDSTLPIAYSYFACELHGDLQRNQTLQDNALTLLVEQVVK